jgi:hypothetical protein
LNLSGHEISRAERISERDSGAADNRSHRCPVFPETPPSPVGDLLGTPLERVLAKHLENSLFERLRRIFSVLVAVVIGLLVALAIAQPEIEC